MNLEFLMLIIIGGLGSGFIIGSLGAGSGLIHVPLSLYILPKLGAHTDAAIYQAIRASLCDGFQRISATIKQHSCKLLNLIFFCQCPFV